MIITMNIKAKLSFIFLPSSNVGFCVKSVIILNIRHFFKEDSAVLRMQVNFFRFACELCDSKFRRQHHLSKHIRSGGVNFINV